MNDQRNNKSYAGQFKKFVYALQYRAISLTGVKRVLGRLLLKVETHRAQLNLAATTGVDPGTPPRRCPLSLLSLYMMDLL